MPEALAFTWAGFMDAVWGVVVMVGFGLFLLIYLLSVGDDEANRGGEFYCELCEAFHPKARHDWEETWRHDDRDWT